MDTLKLLYWNLTGPYDRSGGEPWPQRLGTVGEVLKSDVYDFLVMPDVSAPKLSGRGYRMLGDIIGLTPDYSLTYTRHLPNIDTSHGLLLGHRHSRWESDLGGGFRIWPPNTDRVLFCVLYYELDEEKNRTGRAVYVASCQFRDDVDEHDMDIMREAMAMQMSYYLSKRPHPEYPVIWAGDVGMGAPCKLYDYVTGLNTPIADQEMDHAPLSFQDPLAILHPESKHIATVNNWRDYAEEGARRDFVFISDGLAAHSLDFNYIRTPGGQFPSNHYPQRAVLSFNMAPMGQVLN